MTPTQYQERAARTINKKNNILEQRQHALYGMASEVGEIHGIFQKQYQGHSIDYIELQKELGDLLWFIAEFCTASGWNMEDIMQMNLDKLEGRYPDGFEVKRSVERPEYIQGTLFEEWEASITMNLWNNYNQIKLWQLIIFCLITLITLEFIGIQLFDLLSKHIAPGWHNEVFKDFRYGGIIGWIIETIKIWFPHLQV